MKNIPKWLAESLSRLKNPVKDDQPNDTESVNPDDEGRGEIPLGAEVADCMDKHSAQKNVVMPDIYSDAHDATVPQIKVLDLDLTGIEESPGIDPYDTGILQKK